MEPLGLFYETTDFWHGIPLGLWLRLYRDKPTS